MCALDTKLADQNGTECSFELTISYKQLLGDVARLSGSEGARNRLTVAGKRTH